MLNKKSSFATYVGQEELHIDIPVGYTITYDCLVEETYLTFKDKVTFKGQDTAAGYLEKCQRMSGYYRSLLYCYVFSCTLYGNGKIYIKKSIQYILQS